jgi:NADH dehydrogenase
MRVAVTGANGAVGQAILRVAPHRSVPLDLVAAVRSERAAAELRPLAGAARVVSVSYDDAASLGAALEGTAAVVHLAGILVERPGSTYEDANVETMRRVVDAAKRRGVAKLVLVSAIGADARSANRYWRTKGEAEVLVRASGVSHTVLRVPVLLGRGTEAAIALRRHLRHRTVPLLDGGRTLQQPLAVDDVARAALVACDPDVARNRTLELVGPVAVPGREIVERAARLTGHRARIVPVPVWPLRLALAIARRAGGRRSPDALEVLTTDTRLDPAPAARELGLALTPLDDMIRDSVQP